MPEMGGAQAGPMSFEQEYKSGLLFDAADGDESR
jgi:hypothetical protein